MNSTLEATEALIISGEGYELAVAPDIIEQKADLLKFSALMIEVRDTASSDAAYHQIKKLAAMRIMVEKSRNSVKAPVLAVGKRIDDLAKDFAAEITAEENRLKRLQGDYAAAVLAERNRILCEQEAARQAEQERLRKEQEAAAKLEADRIAAEQAAWEAESPEDEAAAAKAIADAKAAELARLEASMVVVAVVPVFVPEAVKGVKFEWDYEVTDAFALLNHNAGLVDLVSKRSAILDCIKGMAIGDEAPVIPGLQITKFAKVLAR